MAVVEENEIEIQFPGYKQWAAKMIPPSDPKMEQLERIEEKLDAIINHFQIYSLKNGIWRKP